MSNDGDAQPDPGPSSQVLEEDVAARSEPTNKRKSIEEPQSQENPPPKRQRIRKRKAKWNPNALQATTSLPPPTQYAFVHELPQNRQAWGDSTGDSDTHGPSQMYSSQVREYDTNASSSTLTAPTTSVLDAQGMGRGRKHEAYQSKPDLKRKRKAEDVELSIPDAPQPMMGVPTGPRPLPLMDATGRMVFRQAREFLCDDESALILTGMHFIRKLLPSEQYSELLNPDPPVSILRPEWLRSLRHTALRNHKHIMHEFFVCVLIHFCRDISDVPGVLFSSPTGAIGALLTDQDLAILRTRLVMFYENDMDPRYLDGSGRFPLPKEMCYPATTRLRGMALPEDNRITIRLSDVIPRPPATQSQMRESQSSSRQATGLHSSPFSPWPAAPLSRVSLPLPLHTGPATSSGSRTPMNAPASLLSLPQVGVSHLARRSTPAPQPMEANTAQRYSSPHPRPGVPLISQSVGGVAGALDYGGAAAVEGYEIQSGSDSCDPDAWYVVFNVETSEYEWHVPLEHVLEMDELGRKGIEDGYGGLQDVTGTGIASAGTIAPVGYGDDYLHWWTTMTATTTDDGDGPPRLDLDLEGGLVMRAAAAYDVAPLANSNSDWSWNWDDVNANADVNTDGDRASEELGTMVLPQLFSPESGDHERHVLDDDARSGSLDNGVNPATTEALPDSSSPSNAQAFVQVDDVSAALSRQLSELDSWINTSELFGVDGSWIEKVYSDFYYEKTEL